MKLRAPPPTIETPGPDILALHGPQHTGFVEPSLQQARSSQGDVVAPKIAHGWQYRCRTLLRENPAWRALKDEMAQAALSAAWQAFLAQEPTPKVAEALQPIVGRLAPDQKDLARQANEYLQEKINQEWYVMHGTSSGKAGAKFRAKGTDLPGDARRTGEGTLVLPANPVDDAHRRTVVEQTGVPYLGPDNGLLGEGDSAQVQLMQVIDDQGRRGKLVAAKLFKQAKVGDREIAAVNALPDHPGFSRLRESYHGKRTRMMLMDLAALGSAIELMASVRGQPAEKVEPLKLALAYKFIEAVALVHESGVHHGDLAERNFLVAPEAGAPTRVVLADFGTPGFKPDRLGLMSLLFDMDIKSEDFRDVILKTHDKRTALRSLLDLPCFNQRMSDDEMTQSLQGYVEMRVKATRR